jgi:glycosyltransferase involved in cell wall biosynthesis
MVKAALYNKKLSIVLSALPPYSLLIDILAGCLHLHPCQMIVVTNQGNEPSLPSGSVPDCCQFRLAAAGTDRDGRFAIGAEAAVGDMILFLDTDRAIEPAWLLRFLEPMLYGNTEAVLLNRTLKNIKLKSPADVIWPACLNLLSGHESKLVQSLTTPPYALTRKALQCVGSHTLKNPAAAAIKLYSTGLRISPSLPMPEIGAGKRIFRPDWHGAWAAELSPVEASIMGHHLEAIRSLIPKPRGGFTDGGRRRDILDLVLRKKLPLPVRNPTNALKQLSMLYGGLRLSVVIPACNEEATIGPLIRELLWLEPFEIITVVNGTKDRTAKAALQHGSKVLSFQDALGTDVGRAVGASIVQGDIILFIDGDIVLPAEDLYPFAAAIRQGHDVALNNLNHVWEADYPIPSTIPAVASLNMAIQRKELGASSMSIVPFAISRKALQAIGWKALACPPLAQAACAVRGLRMVAPHRVNMERVNRFRPEKHVAASGLSSAAQQIIGDHIEAFHYLLQEKKKS